MNQEKRSAARSVRSRMSQSFKEYTDEIENVKFGMGKSKINKGIEKLTSILDKIEDQAKKKERQETETRNGKGEQQNNKTNQAHDGIMGTAVAAYVAASKAGS